MGSPMSSLSARRTRPGRNSCATGSWAATRAATRTGEDGRHELAVAADRLVEDRPLHVRQHADFGRCPFTCEFCDIIVTFGRRPRLKTSGQILAELESFWKAGFRIVFVVDDNLIGNKKVIKPILSNIVRWQQERGYPLALSTEATLDLAEDEELMQLMGLANFWSVFVGIESPNEGSLIEAKKLQNVRPKAGTLLERVHRIRVMGSRYGAA